MNRLFQADFKSYSGGSWVDPGAMYNTSYTYDPSGNIRTLTRDGSQSNPGPMDNLTYEYEQQPVTGEESNRLQHLIESAPSPSPIAGDLEVQPIQQNYTYDAIGELTGDQSESITSIAWTTYGKVASVVKPNQIIDFLYDAQGNRVRKRVYGPANPTDMAESYYVYEAGGKVVAIYENCVDPEPSPHEGVDTDNDGIPNLCDPDSLDPTNPPPGGDIDGDGVPDEVDPCPCTAGPAGDQDSDGIPDGTDPNPCEPNCAEAFRLAEWVIYGNGAQGRIAETKPTDLPRPAGEGTPIDTTNEYHVRVLSEKYYELKDHLGNVRVVVTDMKEPTVQSGTYPYVAVVSTYANYYAYGMLQPGRHYEGGEWRYGFNGQEMDNDGNGYGAHLVFGDFGYDVEAVHRWNTDPLEERYPMYSPSSVLAQDPINYRDADGREPSRDEVASLSALIKMLKSNDVQDLGDLLEQFGGAPTTFGASGASGGRNITMRYVYSKRWGWLDLRHLAAGAWFTDNWLISGHMVLSRGEDNEVTGGNSSFDFEDLPSNLIGVYFETYLESDAAQGKTVVEALQSYLADLGVVENPFDVAPNADQLKETTKSADTGPKNTSYDPVFTTERRDKPIDRIIESYLLDYLDGESRDIEQRNRDANAVEEAR